MLFVQLLVFCLSIAASKINAAKTSILKVGVVCLGIACSILFSFAYCQQNLHTYHKKNTPENQIEETKLSQNPLKLGAVVLKKYYKPSPYYTQGLFVKEGWVYESSGLYGKSAIVRYRLPHSNFRKDEENTNYALNNDNSIQNVQSLPLPKTIFAEGIAWNGQQIVMLTWREKIAFFLQRNPLRVLMQKKYNSEGWGVASIACHFLLNKTRSDEAPGDSRRLSSHTNNEKNNCIKSKNTEKNSPALKTLVTSDGSEELTFRNPIALTRLKKITVTLKNKPVSQLNELETGPFPLSATAEEKTHAKKNVSQYIYANVWGNDFIAVINLNGEVIAEIDLRSIAKENKPNYALQKEWGVLVKAKLTEQYEKTPNGIAYVNNNFDAYFNKTNEQKIKKKNKVSYKGSFKGFNEPGPIFLLTGKNWQWIYLVKFYSLNSNSIK